MFKASAVFLKCHLPDSPAPYVYRVATPPPAYSCKKENLQKVSIFGCAASRPLDPGNPMILQREQKNTDRKSRNPWKETTTMLTVKQRHRDSMYCFTSEALCCIHRTLLRKGTLKRCCCHWEPAQHSNSLSFGAQFRQCLPSLGHITHSFFKRESLLFFTEYLIGG